MKIRIIVRFLGVLFILGSTLSFAAYAMPEIQEGVKNVPLWFTRNLLTLIAGLGLLLLRKWGVYVWLGNFLFNWIVLFTVYSIENILLKGLWYLLPFTIISALFYVSWSDLK